MSVPSAVMRSAGYVVPPSSVVLVQFERSSRSPFYRWVNNGDREGLLILFLRAPLNLTGIFFLFIDCLIVSNGIDV